MAFVRHQSWFWLQAELHGAAAKLDEALRELRALSLKDPLRVEHPQPLDASAVKQALLLAIEVVYNGDLLLFYHKRLALTDWAYDFLHAHELVKYWTQYEKQGTLVWEINTLIAGAARLLEGYHKLTEDDQRFLDGLDLPADLLADFTLSRNLFSVGFDDMGLFAAGRGLEGVLRAIARKSKLTYINPFCRAYCSAWMAAPRAPAVSPFGMM